MKKIAIVGSAESYKLAPFGDGSYEIWAVPSIVSRPEVNKIDKIFELHDREQWINWLKELNDCGAVIMMQDHNDEVPRSDKYPIADIMQEFGDYLTNTISYMLAYALFVGAKQIDLYGVHMSFFTE